MIIMDWDMPLLNGLQATRCLRENEGTVDTPIIITTGVMMSPKDMQAAFDAGATEYLRKPIEKVELITRVRSMLKLSNKYKEVIDNMNTVLPRPLERLHIVGGGSQNLLLNRLTEEKTGLEVIAGPVEATGMGNVIVQRGG